MYIQKIHREKKYIKSSGCQLAKWTLVLSLVYFPIFSCKNQAQFSLLGWASIVSPRFFTAMAPQVEKIWAGCSLKWCHFLYILQQKCRKGQGAVAGLCSHNTLHKQVYIHIGAFKEGSQPKNIVSHYQSGQKTIDCIKCNMEQKTWHVSCFTSNWGKKTIDLSSTIDCHITWDRHESRSIWTAVAILAPQWEIPWETPAKAQGRLGLEEESTLEPWNCGTLEVDVPDI